MKKINLVIVCILMIGSTQAQELTDKEVPAAVKESLTKRYYKATKIKWSKESANEFEAEFENGELKQAANFDQTGKWLVTETEIKKSALPKTVLAAIAKDFKGYKIEEAERVETPENSMFYEVELEKGELTYSVQFAADGKVLKKEEKKEEEEDKD